MFIAMMLYCYECLPYIFSRIFFGNEFTQSSFQSASMEQDILTSPHQLSPLLLLAEVIVCINTYSYNLYSNKIRKLLFVIMLQTKNNRIMSYNTT